jgi:hypothetical protein
MMKFALRSALVLVSGTVTLIVPFPMFVKATGPVSVAPAPLRVPAAFVIVSVVLIAAA